MDQGKAKILVIDDEDALRESMSAVLEEAGYLVSGAENGGKALDLIKGQYFDILLVDYMLPDMNGIECINQALPLSKDSVPVIITGSSSIEIAVEAMRIGAHDYLLKPVNMDDLLKVLAGILREREEFRKGKTNLDQIVHKIGNEMEPDIVRVVLASDRADSIENKRNLFMPVKQVLNDVVDLLRRSQEK
jgi:DNA-binding NtrC family response regulator